MRQFSFRLRPVAVLGTLYWLRGYVRPEFSWRVSWLSRGSVWPVA
jgi:hypothetical protein